MSSRAQSEAEDRAATIDVAITAGDFTTAADEYELFEKWDSIYAKRYYDSLSPADQAKLRVALDKNND